MRWPGFVGSTGGGDADPDPALACSRAAHRCGLDVPLRRLTAIRDGRSWRRDTLAGPTTTDDPISRRSVSFTGSSPRKRGELPRSLAVWSLPHEAADPTPGIGARGCWQPTAVPIGGWDHAHTTEFPQAHRRLNACLVRRHADRLDAAGHGRDSGRHAQPSRRAEVPDRDADPAGDAPGGDDHHAGRQAGRLLRDLHAAVLPADPARGHAGHDRVGLRRQEVGDQPGAGERLPRALAHHRVHLEAAGADQVDQRAGGCQRQPPAAPAARRSDLALGQPARRGRRPRHAADVHLYAGSLHRSGADRDPP